MNRSQAGCLIQHYTRSAGDTGEWRGQQGHEDGHLGPDRQTLATSYTARCSPCHDTWWWSRAKEAGKEPEGLVIPTCVLVGKDLEA